MITERVLPAHIAIVNGVLNYQDIKMFYSNF